MFVLSSWNHLDFVFFLKWSYPKPGAYIPENLTAWFYPKSSRFTENRQKTSCVWTQKWPKTYEGAELAQNRGQIWTQHA